MPQHVITPEAVKFSSYGGDWDASTLAFPTKVPAGDPTGTTPDKGDWYRVGTAGVVDSVSYFVGEFIVFQSDLVATGLATDWVKVGNVNQDAMVNRGAWAPSGGTFPLGASNGDVFIASDSGTIDSITFVANDLLMATKVAPSTITYLANWQKIPTSGAFTALVQDTDADTRIAVEVTPNSNEIVFTSTGTEVMSIKTDLVDLKQGVSVNHDIRFFTTGIGPVIVSPNGTKFRMIADDLGALYLDPLP